MSNKDIGEIFKKYKVTLNGLSEKEADDRLKTYGFNKFKEAKKKSAILLFLKQFKDSMIIILLITAFLLLLYGLLYSHEYTDMIIILVVSFINGFIGFISELKAEKLVSSLKKYDNTTCKVKRDGEIKVISSENIVPGDIIILESGDLVPADIRIFKLKDAKVDESILTGESIPVEKMVMTVNSKTISDMVNMVFKGTHIVSGNITGIVIATGMDTEMGKIYEQSNTKKIVKTPLELKIEELSRNLTIIIFVFIIFIFILSIIKGYTYLETIMLCASLCVAAIPEGLPAVITVTLSGGIKALAKKNTIVKSVKAIETLGEVDVICSDKTGTITLNQMTVTKDLIYNEEMTKYIMALCNEGLIYDDKLVGDPTETCLYSYLKTKDIDCLKLRKENKRIDYVPFTSERKISTTINKIGNKMFVLTKGSTEKIIDKCSYLNNKKITASDKELILKTEKEYTSDGLRVLAFAYKEIKKIPKNLEDCEESLRFVGLVGIIDPLRDTVIKSVNEAKNAGIRVIMITGDSLGTAKSIGMQSGIIESSDEAILGEELDNYDDDELIDIINKYNVYARVNPLHKVRIVKTLQKQHKVVCMTGDGVNDAPAIKNSHIGVGMGISGTDITKEVSDIVLVDDSFSTIVTAVEEGRRIYTNIRNNVVYSLSSNFAEIFIVLVGLLTNNLILLPIHILFIDLVTDSIPSIALAFEKSEKNIMKKPPRGQDKEMFTPFVRMNIVTSFLIESIYALITYYYGLLYFNQKTAITFALLSVVVQEIVYALSCRNLKESIIKQGIFSNKIMNISLVIIILIELLVFLTPAGNILRIETVNLKDFLLIFIFNSTAVIFYEGFKPVLKRFFKD